MGKENLNNFERIQKAAELFQRVIPKLWGYVSNNVTQIIRHNYPENNKTLNTIFFEYKPNPYDDSIEFTLALHPDSNISFLVRYESYSPKKRVSKPYQSGKYLFLLDNYETVLDFEKDCLLWFEDSIAHLMKE